MMHQNTLLESIVAHASVRPLSPALVHDGVVVHTWASLVAQVGAMATHLRDRGIEDNALVALNLARGPDWVVGALATWAAGGAILPLDPSLPPLRTQHILDSARPHVVIDAHTSAELVPSPSTADLRGPLPGRLAWVLFSSGSTGEPKGVCVPGDAYGAVLAAQVAALGLGPSDRCAWLLSPQFDASLSDIGVALWSGAALCTRSAPLLADPALLVSCLNADAITYADLPPRLLDVLSPDALPMLRAVLCGGEPLPPRGAALWAQERVLIGVYGPTEATICTSLWRVDPERVGQAWIGEPVAGAVLRVVDGELWIGGPGLATGYLGAPALTASRFVVDGEGRRWHRSGDRVGSVDGQLVFRGRIDRQTKIDGRLVCPEEVEAVLQGLPGVHAAAVVVVAQGGASHLEAVVEPHDGAVLDNGALMGILGQCLPSWMVPRRVHVQGLPRTPSGKVDRQELVLPDALVMLVAQVTGAPVQEGVALHALGVDSVRAIQISAALALSGVAVPPEQVRSAENLDALRLAVSRGRDPGRSVAACVAEGKALAEALPAVGQGSPVGPILLTGTTGGLGARVLAVLLGRGQPCLALVRAPDLSGALQRLVEVFWRYRLDETLLQSPLLDVVLGDLDQLSPDGGGPLGHALDQAPWSKVVHLAAAVDLSRDAETLWPVNVGATAGLLALARRRGAPLLFASTLSVFVDTDASPGRALEGALPTGAHIFGGYAQTKLVAEALVQHATGLPRMVVRYGLLGADRNSGRSAPGDWLTAVAQGLASLGVVPEGAEHLAFDLTPADLAAVATVDLLDALGPEPSPLCVHLAAPRALTLGDLIACLEGLGVPLTMVSGTSFSSILAGEHPTALGTQGPAAILGLARAVDPKLGAGLRALDLFQATGWTFDCTQAQRVLGRVPVPAPTRQDLRRLLAVALGLAVLPWLGHARAR